ncbi:MAG: hypothetical protein Q9M26_04005 [Mariprofundales bacterium]|nr:hypothetical protein [Mariprofundales bacterium]
MVAHTLLLGNANGLVILTSAMFAFAQYSDVKHRAVIGDRKALISRKIDDDDLLKDEDIRSVYDEIMTLKRIRLSYPLSVLFVLLLCFALIETAALICPQLNWLKGVIALMGVVLVAVGIWLGILILRMGSERRELSTKVDQFEQLCKVARSFSA